MQRRRLGWRYLSNDRDHAGLKYSRNIYPCHDNGGNDHCPGHHERDIDVDSAHHDRSWRHHDHHGVRRADGDRRRGRRPSGSTVEHVR